MKERSINDDGSVCIVQEITNNEGTSDVQPMVETTKKKCSFVICIRYLQVLMFFIFLMSLGSIFGHLWRNYHAKPEKFTIVNYTQNSDNDYPLRMRNWFGETNDWQN